MLLKTVVPVLSRTENADIDSASCSKIGKLIKKILICTLTFCAQLYLYTAICFVESLSAC